MALAQDNLAQTQQSYRRALSQSKRLPRLRPESGTSTDTDDEEENQASPDQDAFGGEAYDDDFESRAEDEEESVAEEEAAEEYITQEEEEIEEEEELLAAAEEEDGTAAGGSSRESADRLRKEAVKKSQEAVKRLASRLKIAKIGAALTLVGLIVTYLIMTFQFIGGNWLGNPAIPKLSFLEIILWFIFPIYVLVSISVGYFKYLINCDTR